MHDAIKLYFGGLNYPEAVGAILRTSPHEKMCIVDLGTGSGIWVDEMAIEFPNCWFFGVDIAPVASRDPESNVQYEVGELEQTGFHRGFCHFVHRRQTLLGVTDFERVLDEVYRILQPRGYFCFAEWIPNVFLTMENGSIVKQHAPRATEFFSVIHRIVRRRGIATNLDWLEGVMTLRYGQQFDVVQSCAYDNELSSPGFNSTQFRDVVKEYADALKYLMVDSEYTEGEAETLISGFKDEVDVVPGLTDIYTILARKS